MDPKTIITRCRFMEINVAFNIQLGYWKAKPKNKICNVKMAALNSSLKKKLINKSDDPKKKNVIRVILTEEGREVYNMTQNRRSLHRIFSVLSEEEYQYLKSGLYKLLSKSYEETGEKHLNNQSSSS